MAELLFEKQGNESLIPELVDIVLHELSHTPILLLYGDLGAGKTTFSQALFKALGTRDSVTSPTFNIVNTYHDLKGQELYHFDLYRIKHPAELSELGFEDYVDSGRITLIEWPEMAEDLLNLPHLHLHIGHLDGARSYRLWRQD